MSSTFEGRFLRVAHAVVDGAYQVVLIRLALYALPFRTVLRLTDCQSCVSRAHQDSELLELRIRAIRAISRRILPRKPCLAQALATLRVLRLAGRPAVLMIGVRRTPTGRLEAHAWVESDGRTVIGGAGSPGSYAPLSAVHSSGGGR